MPLIVFAHPVDIYDFPIYIEGKTTAIEEVENE